MLTKKSNARNSTEWLKEYVNKPENRAYILANKMFLRLAAEIQITRQKRRISQRDLADRAGVPQSTIVRIEKGRGSNFQTISKVCIAMNIFPKIELVSI
jgi:DNA-binding XRE family transcriptional regulator